MAERMSRVGSIMWGVGQDSTLRMVVGHLIVLDRAPSRSALAERFNTAAHRVERLAQRPGGMPNMWSRPEWLDDDDFDAGDHIRNMLVASPGDQRQVLDLLALLEPSPFDPRMSPWDVTIIEGLEEGRAALYLRAHHSLLDGCHGVALIRSILDEVVAGNGAGAATIASETSLQSVPRETAAVDSNGQSDDRRLRKPGTLTVTIDVAGAVQPIATGVAHGVAAAMRIDPVGAMVRGLQRSLDLANSVSRQVVVTGGRMSPLAPSRQMTSRFEALSVPGARSTARALGGSRNDLLVAGATIGLGLYHERLGMSCSEFRLASPARWRHNSDGGGSVVPARVEIPVSKGHPGPTFGVVAERLSKARREPALQVTELLASAFGHLPGRVLASAVRSQAGSIDFVATSLPGIQRGRHICGSAIVESYPFGPRLGSLMNITGFAVDDRLDIGIALDPAAISDPDGLVACIAEAFQSFAPTHGS